MALLGHRNEYDNRSWHSLREEHLFRIRSHGSESQSVLGCIRFLLPANLYFFLLLSSHQSSTNCNPSTKAVSPVSATLTAVSPYLLTTISKSLTPSTRSATLAQVISVTRLTAYRHSLTCANSARSPIVFCPVSTPRTVLKWTLRLYFVHRRPYTPICCTGWTCYLRT